MKKILENKIINIDENLFDSRFLFNIPYNLNWENEIDIGERLKEFKNEDLNYKKDYKLWSEVYSPKDELRIFEEIVEDTLKNGEKIHISNISLAEEIEIIKKLYLDLGYFNSELNCFQVDFVNAPITIGVNICNIIYSFKDYKSLREKILLIPPPREPRHQKSIKSGINAGIVSMISFNNSEGEKEFLKEILEEEKTSLVRLARCLYYNYITRGFEVETGELIIKL